MCIRDRLHEAGVHLFPQEGHLVLTEGRIDLPQMQVWMVSIPPARELADLKAIAVLCGLAAGATALADKPLDQQGIAPHSSTSLGGIKKTGDISKRLRLIHAVQNRRQIFANGFANGPVLGLRLKTEIDCGGIVEGGFHPQAVIWVIRLTSPHLP